MSIRNLIFFIFINLNTAPFVQAISLQTSQLIETKIPSPPTLADKQLGTALALSGSTVAISAHPDDALSTGSVYIYDEIGSWQLTAELNSQHNADSFAGRIALDGNRLIVSAERDDSQGVDSGAVYIFERNSPIFPKLWQQVAKIAAPDGQTGDRFGHAIALVGNTLYIGAPFRNQGKVYIFSQNTASNQWQFQQSIEPEDTQALRFGAAIAENQNTLIIGAPFTDADNTGTLENQIASIRSIVTNKQNPRFGISKGDSIDPGIQSGAIFVYELINDVWQKSARIGASIRETADHLGEMIAINGHTIAASIKHKDVWDDLRAGSVLTYERVDGSWHEDTALIADIPQLGGAFGNSISMLNNNILVGGNKMHSNGFNSGKAYLFNQKPDNSWQIIHQQTNSAIMAHDQFGLNVALGNEKILVSSKNAVYSFQNSAIAYYPAIYYADQQVLQLDEVAVTETGVFSATLQFSQQADAMLLTVITNRLLKNKKTSDIHYSVNNAQLSIPVLAFQQNNKETQFYKVTLNRVENADNLQFQVSSIVPIN